jgi:hypothetical protein
MEKKKLSMDVRRQFVKTLEVEYNWPHKENQAA